MTGRRTHVHDSKKRKVIPTPETATKVKRADRATVKLGPGKQAWDARRSKGFALEFDRATNLEEVEVPEETLFTVEKIHPLALARSLEQLGAQESLPLFGEAFNGITEEARFKFFEHESNWQNRIIHGDALKAMASLLEKEKAAGTVQCIFWDPPFGINFDAYVGEQMERNRNGGGGGDPASGGRRAFIDTFRIEQPDGTVTLGVAAYLNAIYEQAVAVHRLLADTGCLFLQINNVNVNRIALLLDEIFGPENRVSMISFRSKNSGAGAKLIGDTTNYLLWYAKDVKKFEGKYQPIFEERTLKDFVDDAGSISVVTVREGETRNLTIEERTDLSKLIELEEIGRIGRTYPLVSAREKEGEEKTWPSPASEFYSKIEQRWEIKPNKQWTVRNPEGIDALARKGRLVAHLADGGVINVLEMEKGKKYEHAKPTEQVPQWLFYFKDDPGRQVGNLWDRRMFAVRKKFVVSTSEQILQRCLLMATEPGDLVLDPTAGSGTTAVVAERLGRRWIVCDAGSLQVALARERVLLSIFDDYLLAGSSEGKRRDDELNREAGTAYQSLKEGHVWGENDPGQGFVYARRARVSAGVLAGAKAEETVLRVDRPELARNGKNRRLASPFTVERLARYQTISAEQEIEESAKGPTTERVAESIMMSGLGGLEIGDPLPVTEMNFRLITHIAQRGEIKTHVAIADEDIQVSRPWINTAVDEVVRDHGNRLVIVAFDYADDARSSHRINDEVNEKGDIKVWLRQAPTALQLSKTKVDEAHALTKIAEPAIRVDRTTPDQNGNPQISLTLEGFMIYDPATNKAEYSHELGDVKCWMIDTEYDRQSFFVRRVHFPAPGAKKDWMVKNYLEALGESIDKDKCKDVFSAVTAPMPQPKQGECIAMRLIAQNGDIMSRVMDDEEIADLVNITDK